MAAIAKSWMRVHCTKCQCRRTFVLQAGWVLECSACGTIRRLARNGLLAAG